MPEEVRVLRLGEMVLGRGGPLAGRLVHALVSVALRLFFRRIEMSNASTVPTAGPLLFVLNHPNGLIDPALVFVALPRRISFLAKSTLFWLPVVGFMLRALDTLPIYRAADGGADPALNRLTFEACRDLLRSGRAVALFPEGVSHDEPRLLPLKTGAARIALGAVSVRGEAPPLNELRVVPVGLYYTSKTSFRSEVLLRFGEPFSVEPVALDEQGEPPREEVRRLSARMEEALRAVTLNVEDSDELEAAAKAEKLFSSFYESIEFELPLARRFDFLRRLVANRQRARGGVENLRGRILKYEAELRRMGIEPENLSLSSHSRWHVFRHFLLRSFVLLILSPLALAGVCVHYPAYLLSTLFARLFPKHGIDVAGPTVKILAAMFLMPLTWLVVTGLSWYWWGWRAAVVVFPTTILCGYVAMRSLEELYDMRGWFKAIALLLRRRRLFLRLLWERRALHDEIRRLEGDPVP